MPTALKFRLINSIGLNFFNTLRESSSSIYDLPEDEYNSIKEKLSKDPILVNQLLEYFPDSKILLEIKNNQ